MIPCQWKKTPLGIEPICLSRPASLLTHTMTFTKAIFAASLAAVVIAAPAAQPGNEENKVPGNLLDLLLSILAKINL